MMLSSLKSICCPVCKGDLLFKERKEDRIIQEGFLFCQRCKVDYPIENGIPILERRPVPEILFCQRCGEDVEAFAEPWVSFVHLKGEIMRCSHCNQIIRRRSYKELGPNQRDMLFKKFMEQGFDRSAPVYESFRFPFVSAMLGVNPLTAVHKLIKTPTQRIDVGEGGTVLDVATGTGLAARELSRKVGPYGHVYGLDISIGMLKKGKEKAERKGLANITFLKGDAEELPFKDEILDGITCLNAYGIVPGQWLAEMSRVLRHGSKLVVTAGGKPRKPNLFMWMVLKWGKRYGFTPSFSTSEVTEMLEKYDFVDIDVKWLFGLLIHIEAKKGQIA